MFRVCFDTPGEVRYLYAAIGPVIILNNVRKPWTDHCSPQAMDRLQLLMTVMARMEVESSRCYCRRPLMELLTGKRRKGFCRTVLKTHCQKKVQLLEHNFTDPPPSINLVSY
jgi:hypothetical protein